MTETWPEVYRQAQERLGRGQEARWIIEEATGEPWPPTVAVTDRIRNRVHELTERRAHGEPLQYVLGSWGFRHLDLMVDRRVLIPRPETEQVVDVALSELDRLNGSAQNRNVVDLGTGSGAIALSIANERKRTRVWASDVSADALDVARANLSGMGGYAATRVVLCAGSWWSALPTALKGSVDLVVSNPPYIATGAMASLDPAVKGWEPTEALDAGPTGLEAVDEILSLAPCWLTPSGVAVLEIGADQEGETRELALRSGFTEAVVHQDLAGRPRILVARRR
jgi:release factor glutamine methyltransferase